ASRGPDGDTIKTRNTYYNGVVRFEAHSMIVETKIESGARRITVAFDEPFSRCTLDVVHGKEAGAPGMVMRSLNTKLIMITSATVTGATCTVSATNELQ